MYTLFDVETAAAAAVAAVVVVHKFVGISWLLCCCLRRFPFCVL